MLSSVHKRQQCMKSVSVCQHLSVTSYVLDTAIETRVRMDISVLCEFT